MQVAVIAVAAALAACATPAAPTSRIPAMPTETHKQLARALYEDYLNTNRLDQLGDVISADYVAPTGERGPAAFAANVASLRDGFPDIRFTVEDLVADADRVAVRWSWRATHTGRFRGHAPTGASVTNTGIVIYQLAGGKIIRGWLETDRLGALQQIGAIPAPSGPPAR